VRPGDCGLDMQQRAGCGYTAFLKTFLSSFTEPKFNQAYGSVGVLKAECAVLLQEDGAPASVQRETFAREAGLVQLTVSRNLLIQGFSFAHKAFQTHVATQHLL
jgi:hypothetical protein